MARARAVAGQDDLRELSRRLRRQADGRDRVKQLNRELRRAAQPLVPKLRSAIRALPSKDQNRRRGKPALRPLLARSVTLSVRRSGRSAGVAVFMNPRKMPDGRKSLPQYFEQVPRFERLSHPVFGRQPAVSQHVPAAGYFTRTLGPEQALARLAVTRVIQQTVREIEE